MAIAGVALLEHKTVRENSFVLQFSGCEESGRIHGCTQARGLHMSASAPADFDTKDTCTACRSPFAPRRPSSAAKHNHLADVGCSGVAGLHNLCLMHCRITFRRGALATIVAACGLRPVSFDMFSLARSARAARRIASHEAPVGPRGGRHRRSGFDNAQPVLRLVTCIPVPTAKCPPARAQPGGKWCWACDGEMFTFLDKLDEYEYMPPLTLFLKGSGGTGQGAQKRLAEAAAGVPTHHSSKFAACQTCFALNRNAQHSCCYGICFGSTEEDDAPWCWKPSPHACPKGWSQPFHKCSELTGAR